MCFHSEDWLFAGEKGEGFTLLGGDHFQMRVNPEDSAHIRQSRPDYGPGF